jgi:hypothetical protein
MNDAGIAIELATKEELNGIRSRLEVGDLRKAT